MSFEFRTAAAAALSVAILVSCATTRQVEVSSASGFLGDYSQLQPGEEEEAALLYISPSADFGQYHSILLGSVSLWYARSEPLSEEDERLLTESLYASLHTELAKDFKIVTQPGPGVLEIRAAITEAKGARVVANTVTSVVPQLRALSTLAGMATGTTALVGRAGVEMEGRDSQSRERLIAAVDARAGTKAVRGGIGKWSDAKLAYDAWAVRLRERLASLRAR